MIDFHTHVLPGIDDGSPDGRMTEALLKEERSQGVSLIVATPHFYAHKMSVEGFLDQRAKALEITEEIRKREEEESGMALPEIEVGAEVYYFRGIGKAREIPRLCIGRTRTLLLEMPFQQWDEDVVRDVRDLVERQGLNIVIAHVERYYDFQKKRDCWEEVLRQPLHYQINAGSFVKKGGLFNPEKKRKFCLRFLDRHPDLILGSDCHNMSSRRPNLIRGREEIEKEFGEKTLAGIDAATRAVLE